MNDEQLQRMKIEELVQKVQELEQKLAIAVEALEFYGNPYSWGCLVDGNGGNCVIVDIDVQECKKSLSDNGGHIAREALAKIRKN